MSNDSIEKVQEIFDSLEPTESEKDRLQVDSIKTMNIIKIINNQLSKVDEKNSLKSLAIKKVQQLIANDDPEVSFIALIKLIEILDKSDNDLTLGLYDGITNIVTNSNGLLPEDRDKKESDSDTLHIDKISFSKEDFQKFKKAIDIFTKLEESEF